MESNNNNNNNNNETSFLKKMLEFFKKNPVLGSSVATIILYVVGIFILILVVGVIFYQVIALFSSLFGIKENDLVSGKYSDKSLTELQETDFGSCYSNTNENDFGAFWDKLLDDLSVGMNSACEIVDVVNSTIKKYENEYSEYELKLSHGLVVSTIIYSYSSQPHKEGEDFVNSAYPMEILEAIAKENILTRKDIDSIVNSMILYESYWYYNCNEISCDEKGKDVDENTEEVDIKSGKQCSKSLYFDIRFSREKYEVFLRYGEEAASYYETAQNHNNSLPYVCDTCYVEFNSDNYYEISLDTEKYLKSVEVNSNKSDDATIVITDEEANILNSEIDKINSSKKLSNKYKPDITITSGKTFTYEDGFIYNKFPKYKESFDNGTYVKDEVFTFKTIEKTIGVIESNEETLNDVYGIGEISSESKGHANNNIETVYGKKQCPSEKSCDCKNGNLRPTSGKSIIADLSTSAMCQYLQDAASVMIRLYGCNAPHALGSPSLHLPGGSHKGTINGESVNIANSAISLEQYIKYGPASAEIYGSASIEALKAQGLIYQSYLLSKIERDNPINSAGEFEIKDGSCFQNYKEEEFKILKNGRYESNLTVAYEEIKDKLLINENGTVTFSEYNDQITDQIMAAGANGSLYPEIFENVIKTSSKSNDYTTATIKSCNASANSEAGTFVADGDSITFVDTSGKYNQMSPKKGIFGSFPYYDTAPGSTADNYTLKMNPSWEKANTVKISKNCGNGLNMSWRVHKLAKSTFETVMSKMCEITTTGIDGIVYSPSQIKFSGPLVIRFVKDSKSISLHSWGIAIDVNPGVTINVNGTNYQPYDRKLSRYESFINALGSESDKRNVNYNLYKKIFQPLGFNWGGNWERFGNSSTFDGMHFEIDWRQTK